MGFASRFTRTAKNITRSKDQGVTGFNKVEGTTGGSFAARRYHEAALVLNDAGRDLNSTGLPGTFSFNGTEHIYTDQYDRQIVLTDQEVEGNAEQALDRICITYEQEALTELLGRQYSFGPQGEVLFTSEVNNKPMTAVLSPHTSKVEIYLPEQQDDAAALTTAKALLPESPDKVAIRARRAAAGSETWGTSPRNFSNNTDLRTETVQADLDESLAKQQELRKLNPQLGADITRRIQTLEAARASGTDAHSHLMPEKFADYFAKSEYKHFNLQQPGSTFTELNSFNELLSETFNQRGTLQGDDRSELIALGADHSSFTDDKRYLMVRTPGKLGAVRSSTLDENTPLRVIKKSPESRPVCVTPVDEHPTVNYATVVIADNPTMPGTTEAPGLLITAFPGVSTESGSSADLEPYVGQSITVGKARKIFGREFSVNTISR